ncbi:hypothetical protein V6Z12_D07G003300 [Gossypium hirsutum]
MVLSFSSVILVSVLILSYGVNSEPVQDKQALLTFLSMVKHENRIQWNSSTSACDWVGVECDATRSFVFTLRLPGVGLVGSIPPKTIGLLNRLRVLSLRANRLSGTVPADFSNLTLLRSLYLQENQFTGSFPSSLTRLTRLQRRPDRKEKPVTEETRAAPPAEAGTSSSKDDVTGGSIEREKNKLVFFESGVYSFDLEDLLRASAEVLGKGSVGTSYKAVLEEGTAVVVKRLKDVAASKREFEMQKEKLGKIKHEKVVPLRAFYYSKDEKLLVYEFMPNGSLSALLHGSRGSGHTPLDWDNRIKIALSTAKGLSYLHLSQVAHGNIKSSNILLGPNREACISDYGLNPLFGNTTPPSRVTGYRAPEVLETRNVTFKSDVYSFGVLLLELLTGKSPSQASLGEEGIDLPRWVQSVVREEWTAEVFDAELMRYHNIEEEMVQLLQIAMTCVSVVPDQRPAMVDVVRMIEDLNRAEIDDGLPQSSDANTPPTESRIPPTSATP